MDSRAVALVLIGLGVAAVVAGTLLYFGGLSWFGHLPGDVRIDRPQLKVFFPLTSMLLISLILSLVLFLLRRLF